MEFDPKGVFSFRPDGENRKKAFWTQLDEVRQPGFLPSLEKPTRNGGMKPTSWYSILRVFFRIATMGKVEKTRFERNWTTFVNPAFCPAWKSPLKMVVWNRPSGIGAKRKNTLGIEFHEVGFIPSFWVGFSKQGKKPGWRTSSNCVQNAFFRLSPSGRNEKTPLGSNSTRSVSYHHFEWAFPSRAKSRVDERRPIAFKTRFFDFPHRGETKKHP